jgi:hypothetical protein
MTFDAMGASVCRAKEVMPALQQRLMVGHYLFVNIPQLGARKSASPLQSHGV